MNGCAGVAAAVHTETGVLEAEPTGEDVGEAWAEKNSSEAVPIEEGNMVGLELVEES